MSVTAVLHDTYLNMVAHTGPSFTGHAHFMGYATRVMRGLIVDHVRKHRSIKGGGAFKITSLEVDEAGTPTHDRELVEIRDALHELAKDEPGLAEVVDLKFFHGLSSPGSLPRKSCRNARCREDGKEPARISAAASVRPIH